MNRPVTGLWRLLSGVGVCKIASSMHGSHGKRRSGLKKMRRALVVLAAGCASAVVLAGCGGGSGGESGGGGGGGGESVTLVSDLPLQGANRQQTESMVNAIELALEQRNGMAGEIPVEYRSLDDSVAQTGSWDEAKCAQNAQETAQDETVVGWIGPFNSGCAAVQIPILNEAGLAMTSPANTALGLTKEGGEPDEPDKYYRNNFV